MKAIYLIYLSLFLLCSLNVHAVGDTFGMVQGSVDSGETIYFEVFANDIYLFNTPDVQINSNKYALSVTIPNAFHEVTIIPVLDNKKSYFNYLLSSGETLQIDIVSVVEEQIDVTSSSVSSFDFQPDDNKRMIDDIFDGEYESYKDDITIMPIPEIISQNKFIEEDSVKEISKEIPGQTTSLVKKINDFFLNPFVLLIMAVVASLLIVLIVLKDRSSKYL